MGGSVGPFDRPDIKKRVVDNLSLTSAIIVRENLSYKYLSDIPELEKKTYLAADPAFQMEPAPYSLNKEEGKLYVGINMSKLAVGHSIRDEKQQKDSKALFAGILDSFLDDNRNVHLVFIPHVNQDGAQNDLNFLRPVYEKMRHKDEVTVIESGLGARKTKGLLANLDLLVAARMHCCVGGISVATPTLFVTYSNKGRGMSHYAYGNHEYEIECSDLFNNPEQFKALMNNMLKNRDDIRRHLKESQMRFHNDSLQAGQILLKTLKS